MNKTCETCKHKPSCKRSESCVWCANWAEVIKECARKDVLTLSDRKRLESIADEIYCGTERKDYEKDPNII